MDNMSIWLVIGAAVAIATICVLLLQKKASEAKKYLDELQALKSRFAGQGQQDDEDRPDDGAVQELQKKIDGLSATLQSAKDQNAALQAELNEAQEKLSRAEEQLHHAAETGKNEEETGAAGQDEGELAAEIASLKKELEEKTRELKTVEERFEKQMEEVVQSSIQKISHAEQAKEEAIQAAQDNFEAAAEANAKLKEKEQLIKQLQG